MAATVLVGMFMHETNTFSVQPADLEAYRRMVLVEGEALVEKLAGTNSEIAGFLDKADEHGWHVVPTVGAIANPCGRVTDECFEWVVGRMVEAARAHPDIRGVLLALHGAMVSESHDDAEGEIVGRLRHILGRRVPIAVTLDLHANVSDRLAREADILVSYRTYPHIDMRERGREAGELLEAAMHGRVRPVTVVARRPMLDGPDAGRTDAGPTLELMDMARAYRREPGVLAISVNAGFPKADIPDVGPTVTVTGNGESPRWRHIAETIMDRMWVHRRHTTNEFLTPDRAAAIAKGHNAADGRPLVIADFSDNPGAGAYGDATNLLKAMLDAGLQDACFACIRDPEAAAALVKAGVGATVTLPVGGKVAPEFGGGPLELAGQVVHAGDGRFVNDGPMWAGLAKSLGPTAVLRVGGVDIVVATNLMQVTDRQVFLSNGIDPTRKRTVALKSMQHFRAAFQPIASKVIVCDSRALASPDHTRLPYHKVRRPIFPLDPDVRADGTVG